MLNNLPKPLVVGVTIIAVVVAIFFVFKTLKGGGENADRPSKEEIINMQKNAAAQNGGHAQAKGNRKP